jgi:hypothetical protein
MGLQDGVETVRNVFERALTTAGLHAANGAVLWEAYREFENVMLGMIQSRANTDLSESQRQELAAQKKRVVSIFTSFPAYKMHGLPNIKYDSHIGDME